MKSDFLIAKAKLRNNMACLPIERHKRSTEKVVDIMEDQITRCIGNICDLAEEFALPPHEKMALEKLVLRAFAEATLPKVAPILFDPDREGRGGIVDFLTRVWFDPWIATGVFTRPYFRRVDARGEMALQNFLRNPDNTLPFVIPGKSREHHNPSRRVRDEK